MLIKPTLQILDPSKSWGNGGQVPHFASFGSPAMHEELIRLHTNIQTYRVSAIRVH